MNVCWEGQKKTEGKYKKWRVWVKRERCVAAPALFIRPGLFPDIGMRETQEVREEKERGMRHELN